jgi:hypothetical protein
VAGDLIAGLISTAHPQIVCDLRPWLTSRTAIGVECTPDQSEDKAVKLWDIAMGRRSAISRGTLVKLFCGVLPRRPWERVLAAGFERHTRWSLAKAQVSENKAIQDRGTFPTNRSAACARWGVKRLAPLSF